MSELDPELLQSKIFWHSRRGMLELDLLLVPFAGEAYELLALEDKKLYRDFWPKKIKTYGRG